MPVPDPSEPRKKSIKELAALINPNAIGGGGAANPFANRNRQSLKVVEEPE